MASLLQVVPLGLTDFLLGIVWLVADFFKKTFAGVDFNNFCYFDAVGKVQQ
jgi:hypothetical protein